MEACCLRGSRDICLWVFFNECLPVGIVGECMSVNNYIELVGGAPRDGAPTRLGELSVRIVEKFVWEWQFRFRSGLV